MQEVKKNLEMERSGRKWTYIKFHLPHFGENFEVGLVQNERKYRSGQIDTSPHFRANEHLK